MPPICTETRTSPPAEHCARSRQVSSDRSSRRRPHRGWPGARPLPRTVRRTSTSTGLRSGTDCCNATEREFMDITGLAATAAELRETVNGDGVELRLVALSEADRRVELELGLEDAGCADCVLPPDALQAMVESTLQRRPPGDYAVVVHDPRVAPTPAAPREHSAVAVIVSPAASVAAGNDSPGPEAGPLAGLTVSF